MIPDSCVFRVKVQNAAHFWGHWMSHMWKCMLFINTWLEKVPGASLPHNQMCVSLDTQATVYTIRCGLGTNIWRSLSSYTDLPRRWDLQKTPCWQFCCPAKFVQWRGMRQTTLWWLQGCGMPSLPSCIWPHQWHTLWHQIETNLFAQAFRDGGWNQNIHYCTQLIVLSCL